MLAWLRQPSPAFGSSSASNVLNQANSLLAEYLPNMVTRHRDTGKGRAEEGTSQNASLPLAVDAAMSLSSEELGVLQEQYLIEQDKGFVSTQTKFNLAW